MWRQLLDERFTRALRTRFERLWDTPRPRRSRLVFERLEPRLLLSADLAPVEGVLEVIGTNETDFAFITARQERLLVELNGQAFDFALEDVKEIRVGLLDGNDTLRLEAGVALPAVQIDLGEGDNRFEADLLNPAGALSVDAGGGDDTMVTRARWDGTSVDKHPDFVWLPTYNPGAGDDSVHAELSTAESFVLGDGSVRVDARILAGDGNDTISFDLSQLLVGATRAPVVQIDLDGGLGDDVAKVTMPVASQGGAGQEPIDPAERRAPVSLRYDSRAGTDAFELIGGAAAERYDIQAFDDQDLGRTFDFAVTDLGTGNPLVEAAVLSVTRVAVDTGAGNDLMQGRILLDADWNVELGAGDDVAVIETLIGDQFADAHYRVDAGDGDNETLLVFGDGEHGARLPSGETRVTAEYRSGGGDDRVSFDWRAHLDRPLTVGLDVLTGAGDDVIDVSAVMGVEPQPFLPDVALAMTILAGEGDDRVDVRVTLQEASSPDSSAALDIAVDLGAGQDAARMDCTSNLKQLALGMHVVDPDAGLDLNISTRGLAQRIYANVEATEHGNTVATEVLGSGDTSAATEAIFYVLDISGSPGDDILDFAASGVFDEMQLAVDMGDGNDTVMFNPTELTIRKSADWKIDTGAGDDELVVETSGVRLAAQSRVQWLIDMGAGNDDVTHIRENWEIDAGVDYRWAVALGEGDDTLKASVDGQTIGEGASASYDFSGGDGDDRIEVSLANLALAAGAAFTAKTDAGNGNDLVAHELTHIVQQGGIPPPDDQKPAEFLVFTGAGDDTVADSFFDVYFDIEVRIDTGDGDDVLEFNAVMGIEPRPFQPVLNLDIRAGDGDDSVHAAMLLPAVQSAREAAHKVHVDLGDGDDVLQLDVFGGNPPDDSEPGDFKPAEFKVFGGAGEDALVVHTGDTAPVNASFKNVEGLDSETEVIEYQMGIDAVLREKPRTQINMAGMEAVSLETGAGADRIVVEIDEPSAPIPVLKLDTGAGDDTVSASYHFTRAWPAKWSGPFLDVNAGLGIDKVSVDAKGPFVELDLGVDLGADAANPVAVEQLTLTYEKIDIDYHAQAEHEYAYDPESASASSPKAVYHAGLRSDGELVQAVFSASTIAGIVGDQVNIDIGDNRTETVGSNVSVTVSSQGGTVVPDGRIAATDTPSGAHDIRVFFEGLDDTRMTSAVGINLGAGTDSLVVDLGANDVPTHIGFANVTGLGSEVTAAEYRAGAEIGDKATLNVDMRGVDALTLKTGDAADTIEVHVDHTVVAVPALKLDTGAGNDDVMLQFATGGSRSDRIDAELGAGADRFELRWSGALQDPSVDLRVDLRVDPGSADPYLPEIGDEVLVSFEHGDLDRPIVIGMLWNSKDAPPDGANPPDDGHLQMSLSSTRGVLSADTALLGGAGSDEVTFFVRGNIDASAIGSLSAAIDLGDGDDAMTIDFAGLRSVGPKKLAPISLELRGGAGRDMLAVTGTESNDKFTLSEHAVILEGAANANFTGFESVRVHAGGGNDQVAMTGLDPRIDWRVDGGDGHDQFIADFDLDGNPRLAGFEKIKTKKPR